MHFRGYFKRCKGNTHNNNPCDKWAEPRSRFCCDHVCLIRNCIKLRVEGIRTCAFRRSLALPLKLHHLTCTYSDTCRTRLCPNIVTPTESTPAKYCSVHACSQQHCLRDTVADVSFCKAHACIRDDCTLQRAGRYSAYCGTHECRARGCLEGVWVGGYCLGKVHGPYERGVSELEG